MSNKPKTGDEREAQLLGQELIRRAGAQQTSYEERIARQIEIINRLKEQLNFSQASLVGMQNVLMALMRATKKFKISVNNSEISFEEFSSLRSKYEEISGNFTVEWPQEEEKANDDSK